MGILHDDVVLIRHPDKEGDPTVITVNCPDKTGLGCDLCRIILFFGLGIARGGTLIHLLVIIIINIFFFNFLFVQTTNSSLGYMGVVKLSIE